MCIPFTQTILISRSNLYSVPNWGLLFIIVFEYGISSLGWKIFECKDSLEVYMEFLRLSKPTWFLRLPVRYILELQSTNLNAVAASMLHRMHMCIY